MDPVPEDLARKAQLSACLHLASLVTERIEDAEEGGDMPIEHGFLLGRIPVTLDDWLDDALRFLPRASMLDAFDLHEVSHNLLAEQVEGVERTTRASAVQIAHCGAIMFAGDLFAALVALSFQGERIDCEDARHADLLMACAAEGVHVIDDLQGRGRGIDEAFQVLAPLFDARQPSVDECEERLRQGLGAVIATLAAKTAFCAEYHEMIAGGESFVYGPGADPTDTADDDEE